MRCKQSRGEALLWREHPGVFLFAPTIMRDGRPRGSVCVWVVQSMKAPDKSSKGPERPMRISQKLNNHSKGSYERY